MEEIISIDDKINALEDFTKRHFVTHQLVDYGLLEYFAMLRQKENIEFLDDLNTYDELAAYTFIIRDTHQTSIR